MNDTSRRTTQLAKAIRTTLRRWGKSLPSLPDVADQVAGWKKDIENMDVLPEINGNSYQSALSLITKAWENRDDKQKMLDDCAAAADELDNISVEMETPDFQPKYAKRHAKALFNDASQYAMRNNEISDIYQIKRLLGGMQKGGMKAVNYTNIKAVRDALISLADSHGAAHPIYHTAMKAVQYVNAAHNSDNVLAKMRYLGTVEEMVDEIGNISVKSHTPTGYIPELDSVGAQDILKKHEGLRRLVNGYNFSSPDAFLPQAIKASRDIIAAVNLYFDPRAKRLAANMHDSFVMANNQSHSARVKSLGMGGWNADEVFTPFDTALNYLSELETHLYNVARGK